jgi:HTH-type transcriptional regulator/antitoxin HigA
MHKNCFISGLLVRMRNMTKQLDLISDLVADYEEEHYPVKKPSSANVAKFRIYETNYLPLTKLSSVSI